MIRRRVARRPRSRGLNKGRLLVALGMAAFAVISYLGSRSYNPVTDETQYVSITPEQEIALGLQAAPQMARQHGGLYPDDALQAYLDEICVRLIQNGTAAETDWPFACHLLADEQTVNAFAQPGGQMFMTAALYARLQTEGQVAGVMAHEIGHVLARHSAQRLAQQELTQGLTGAAVIAAYDPNNPNSRQAAQVALLIGQVVNMKFGRDDELQSDELGVRLLADAGYDPRALIEVMRVLEAATAGNAPPEFFSTHPNPDNRIANIEAAIAAVYPDGVPAGLDP